MAIVNQKRPDWYIIGAQEVTLESRDIFSRGRAARGPGKEARGAA
jgi:hypothetical protein